MMVLSFLLGEKRQVHLQAYVNFLGSQGVTADSSFQVEHRCEDCTAFEGWFSNLGFIRIT